MDRSKVTLFLAAALSAPFLGMALGAFTPYPPLLEPVPWDTASQATFKFLIRRGTLITDVLLLAAVGFLMLCLPLRRGGRRRWPLVACIACLIAGSAFAGFRLGLGALS